VLFSQRAQIPAAGQNSEISDRDYRPAFTACGHFRVSLPLSGSGSDCHIPTACLFDAIATKPRASHLITASSFTHSVSCFKASFLLTGVGAGLLGHQPEDQF
jgi:hypothetical protein